MAESPDYDLSTYQRSADVYDVMNAARGKSYGDEAATLLRLIRQHVADAESLLDVACGTGLHLSHLRHDLRVEGIEPHPRLRAIARDRLDGVPVHDGDMRTFDLGRRFDVVTCLFSAIGYMLNLEDLRTAIGQMAAHVSPGGLLVVEPWFHPEAWIDGLVMAESATTEDMAITRLSHSAPRRRHLALRLLLDGRTRADPAWPERGGRGDRSQRRSSLGGPLDRTPSPRVVVRWPVSRCIRASRPRRRARSAMG